MTVAPAVKPRPQATLDVIRAERLSEHFVRIVAGGPGFTAFEPNGFTDMYVKIHFLRPGVRYPEPVDVFGLREFMPREDWPATRTYTVRWVNTVAGELAIDFVVHGDEGLAGPWAAAAKPGDRLIVSGPGGAYAPDPAADWYLFAGDESAVPAISAALEALPAGAVGHAFLEVGAEDDALPVAVPAGITLEWLVRDGTSAVPGSILVESVAGMPWRAGDPQVFAHGEREAMKALREIFFKQRQLPRSRVSLSGYWAYGRNEDSFQAEKKTPLGKV